MGRNIIYAITKRLREPSESEIQLFFEAVNQKNSSKIKKMLEHGFPVNVLVGNEEKQNVALRILDTDWSENALILVELLIDFGLNINHRDKSDNGILVYLLEYLSWWEFEDDVFEAGVPSKYHLDSVLRLRETFDKVMEKKPSLEIGKIHNGAKNIFELAESLECLHWFSPHEEHLSETDKAIFKDYRLAALLGK